MKVLLVAQHFPPAGGVGAFRVTKFVKYLHRYGWEPVILTVREECCPANGWLDRDLEKDIPPQTRIYRTRVWRTRLFNDEGIRWLPYLLPALVKVIREEHPDIVYLTGGPFFPLVAGPIAKLLFRIPYVVDLRDPWKLTQHATPSSGLKALLGCWLTRVCEPIVVRLAASVICVSDGMGEEYRRAYGATPREKFVVITNGYDPSDTASVEPISFSGVTAVYTGKFRTSDGFRDPAPFFQAVRRARDSGHDIRFVHVGAVEAEVVTAAERAGVRGYTEFAGPGPYRRALAYAKGADVLVLIAGGYGGELTTKVFDYIGCNRPILAIADTDSGIAKLLHEVPNARVVEAADSEALASELARICFPREEARGEANEAVLRRYHREYLTGQLAAVLREAVEADRPNQAKRGCS